MVEHVEKLGAEFEIYILGYRVALDQRNVPLLQAGPYKIFLPELPKRGVPLARACESATVVKQLVLNIYSHGPLRIVVDIRQQNGLDCCRRPDINE
jgi:hypothetical protein